MKWLSPWLVVGAFIVVSACTPTDSPSVSESTYDPSTDSLRFDGETHLRNIRQLTFGGNNAEAYWSFDDNELVFQSDWSAINDQGCDQIFVMKADGSSLPGGTAYREVSTGQGRTTCTIPPCRIGRRPLAWSFPSCCGCLPGAA